MNSESFQRLITELEGLTAKQREALAERIRVLSERTDSARLIGERLGTSAACVHCASAQVVRFGHSHGQQRFRCKACGKTFMALTGTPFLRLRDKEKLLAHADCMSRSLTIRDTAQTVGLTVDCAFRWRHRFLEFLAQQQPQGMTGVVEADETFFRRSYKGQRCPASRFAASGQETRGSSAGWDGKRTGGRAGGDATRRADDHRPSTPRPQRGDIDGSLAPGPATRCHPEHRRQSSYSIVAANLGIEAGRFVASYHGHGDTGIWHVQNVNAYDSRLKGWMHRFHGVATKYLHYYLGWRRLLDRFKDSVTGQQLLFHALRPQYVNI